MRCLFTFLCQLDLHSFWNTFQSTFPTTSGGEGRPPKSPTHFVDITLRSLKGRIHLEGCKGERALPHGMSEEDHLVLEPFARYALSAIKSLRLLSSGTAGTDEDFTMLCTRQMLRQNPFEYLSFVLCHALLLAKQWTCSIFRQSPYTKLIFC